VNILIIGAGAIGCLVASRLAHNIHPEKNITVTLAGRQSLVDAFEKHGGLRVTERDTTETITNISAAASIFDAYKQVKVSPTPELDAFDFIFGSIKPIAQLASQFGHIRTSRKTAVSKSISQMIE